jgi:hypothetical protein
MGKKSKSKKSKNKKQEREWPGPSWGDHAGCPVHNGSEPPYDSYIIPNGAIAVAGTVREIRRFEKHTGTSVPDTQTILLRGELEPDDPDQIQVFVYKNEPYRKYKFGPLRDSNVMFIPEGVHVDRNYDGAICFWEPERNTTAPFTAMAEQGPN